MAQIVADLLTDREQELELWIRPERAGYGYTVEWTALEYDREEQEWRRQHQGSAAPETTSDGLWDWMCQALSTNKSMLRAGMPTFDADREQINVFQVDDTYLFKHYFEQGEVFSQLRQYYNESDYRFEVPADELQSVRDLLEEHFFELVVVDDLERFCVVKRKYTDHPDVLFKASVLEREKQDSTVFLMTDQLSVEQAVNNGATRVADTDLEIEL